jgi:hypothetical protein
MKMEQTACSETLAFKIQTPVDRPEQSIQQSEHGESLKSKAITFPNSIKNLFFVTVTRCFLKRSNAIFKYHLYEHRVSKD